MPGTWTGCVNSSRRDPDSRLAACDGGEADRVGGREGKYPSAGSPCDGLAGERSTASRPLSRPPPLMIISCCSWSRFRRSGTVVDCNDFAAHVLRVDDGRVTQSAGWPTLKPAESDPVLVVTT